MGLDREVKSREGMFGEREKDVRDFFDVFEAFFFSSMVPFLHRFYSKKKVKREKKNNNDKPKQQE